LKKEQNITVEIFSFGFKYYNEAPPECDLRIDLRNKMKNPQNHLPRGVTGKDKIVINTILESSQNKKYIASLLKRIKPKISGTKKDRFTIRIGCRGGIHRSVVVTNPVNEHLAKLGYTIISNHINLKLKK